MVRLMYETQDINKKSLSFVTKKYIGQLEEYKNNRNLIPGNTDGISIVIDGYTMLKNSYDPVSEKMASNIQNGSGYGVELKPSPGIMEVIGAEQFLMVQGHCFYGDVYCHKDTPIGEYSSIAFMSKEKLALIPFYDLYILKANLEKRYAENLVKMKEKMERTFKKVIREIEMDIDKMFTRS
jgi:hypothetical protein